MPDDPGPVSHHWTSSRLRLHYLDWGNAGAPLLVLIHGGEDHARSWDRVARALRRDWHVIAPDLRGHGDSDWSADGAYPMVCFAGDLAGLVAAITPEDGKVTLVGHSLGGAIALRHAALFPEAVARVVAIEGLGISPARAAERAAISVVDHWRDWIGKRRVLAARPPRRFDTVAAALARMQARFPQWPEALTRHLTEHALAAAEGGGYRWKFDPLFRSHLPVEVVGADLHAFWHCVACPALLVYGADSWASNPAEDGRATHFRDACTVLVPDAGHWVQHDRHDLFMAALGNFLAEGAV